MLVLARLIGLKRRASLTRKGPWMTWSLVTVFAVLSSLALGCANQEILKDTLTKLEESRKGSEEIAISLEAFKKETALEIQKLRQEQDRLAKALVTARTAMGDTQIDLESTEYHLANERKTRAEIESMLSELEMERKVLTSKVEVLERRLDSVQEKLGSANEARGRALARIEVLEKENTGLAGDLTRAESSVAQLKDTVQQLDRLNVEFRRERSILRKKVEGLRVELRASQKALTSSNNRVDKLEQDKKRATTELTKVRAQAKMLESLDVTEQKSRARLEKALSEAQ